MTSLPTVFHSFATLLYFTEACCWVEHCFLGPHSIYKYLFMCQSQMDDFRDPWLYRQQEVEDHLPWQLQEEYLLPFASPEDHFIAAHQEEDSPLGEDSQHDEDSQHYEDPLDKMYAMQNNLEPYAVFASPASQHDEVPVFGDYPGNEEEAEVSQNPDYENVLSSTGLVPLSSTGLVPLSSTGLVPLSSRSLPDVDDDISDHNETDDSSALVTLSSTDVGVKRKRTTRLPGSATSIQLFKSTDIFWHSFDEYLVVNGTWSIARKSEKNMDIPFVHTSYAVAYKQMLFQLRSESRGKNFHRGPKAFCEYSLIDGVKLGTLLEKAFHCFVNEEAQPTNLYFNDSLKDNPSYQKLLLDSASHMQSTAPWGQSYTSLAPRSSVPQPVSKSQWTWHDIFQRGFNQYIWVHGAWTMRQRGGCDVTKGFADPTKYDEAYGAMKQAARVIISDHPFTGNREYCKKSSIDGTNLGKLVQESFQAFMTGKKQHSCLYFDEKLSQDPSYLQCLH